MLAEEDIHAVSFHKSKVANKAISDSLGMDASKVYVQLKRKFPINVTKYLILLINVDHQKGFKVKFKTQRFLQRNSGTADHSKVHEQPYQGQSPYT